MTDTHYQLIEPIETMADEFRAFCAEFPGVESMHGIGPLNPADPLNSIRLCREQALGRNLAKRWVPATTYWLVENGRTILGCLNLRHELNDYLLAEGGHIGYSVRPSRQREGHATRMLALALERAKELGIARVLVTCGVNNPASARVIEKNGGVLENEVPSTVPGRDCTRRYWIKAC